MSYMSIYAINQSKEYDINNCVPFTLTVTLLTSLASQHSISFNHIVVFANKVLQANPY